MCAKNQEYCKKNAKPAGCFEVYDIPAVVYRTQDDEFIEFNDLGNQFSVGACISEGLKITKKEYDKLVAKRAAHFKSTGL